VPDESVAAVLAAPVDFKLGGNLGSQIKEHWRKYRPRMFKDLEKISKLDAAVHNAEVLTVEAYDQAVRSGLNPDQARELVREEWAFLPDEEDVRRLPSDRDPKNLANLPGRSPESATSPERAGPGRTLGRVPQEHRPDA
jgi:hypothetical protein